MRHRKGHRIQATPHNSSETLAAQFGRLLLAAFSITLQVIFENCNSHLPQIASATAPTHLCGVAFIMNGANHRMNSVTTYPFNIMGGGWERFAPRIEDLPYKGDTVVGNDVWIGQNATVMPGVHIGDGSIIAANAVVTGDIPPYSIAGGNPCRVIRSRFDQDLIDYLLNIKWWDWDADKIFRYMDALCSADLRKIRNIKD